MEHNAVPKSGLPTDPPPNRTSVRAQSNATVYARCASCNDPSLLDAPKRRFNNTATSSKFCPHCFPHKDSRQVPHRLKQLLCEWCPMFSCATRQLLCIQHACLHSHSILQHVSPTASCSWHTVQLVSTSWHRVVNTLRCPTDSDVDGIGSGPTSPRLGTWTRTFINVSCTAWFCVAVNKGTARGGGGDLVVLIVVLSESRTFGADENNMFGVEEHNTQE